MLSLFKSNRCQICYSERQVRQCHRKRKKTCWKCCNELRCDGMCPTECPYAPKTSENDFFPAFKADSRTENENVSKLHIDLWISRPHPALEMQSPSSLAKSNPSEALAWLSGFQYPQSFPLGYLMDKLGLKHEGQPPEADPERIAENYLNSLIKLDYNSLRQWTINDGELPDISERYAELLSGIPALAKIGGFSVLHSGLGEDGTTALVYLEINHKSDWTLVLTNRNGRWQIRQNLAGSPQLFYAQNQAYSGIAEALGKAEDGEAWENLVTAFRSYPDSADLYYYRALYWQLVKQPDKATVDFFNAVALDNAWPEPYFHLGAIYLGKKDYEQALMWLKELARLVPDNPNALNNLAAAYAASGRTQEAKGLWQDIEKRFPGFGLATQNLQRLKELS